MATMSRNKNYRTLDLLLGEWKKTMRLVVKKQVLDSSPDKNNPWSLDDFLENSKIDKVLDDAKADKETRKKLKRPTNIENWDVSNICLILLVFDQELKRQDKDLYSGAKEIRKIRNKLSHRGSFEIEETTCEEMIKQIQIHINKGLKYINDENSTKEINREIDTIVNDAATREMKNNESLAICREWFGSNFGFGEKYGKGMTTFCSIGKKWSDSGSTTEQDKTGIIQEQYLSVDEYLAVRNQSGKKLTHRYADQDKPKLVSLREQSEGIVGTYTIAKEEKKLAETLPRFTDEAGCHKTNVKDKRILVVAGDPCSGKKSLINLLLGASILPVGKTRSPVGIIAIYKGKLTVKLPNEIATMPENQETAQDVSKAVLFVRETLSSYTNIDTGETSVGWPFDSDLLQDDVIIVVKTGVSDDCSLLLEFLSIATAFIYVVDCGRADGIKTNRMKSIRSLQRSYCRKKMRKQLEGRRTILLLNKWDVISSGFGKERQAERENRKWLDSVDTMKMEWTDMKPEHILKASIWQEIGLVNPCIGIESDQTERVRLIIYSLFDEDTHDKDVDATA